MKHLALLVVLPCLAGCFLEQKAPQAGEPAPTQTSTQGIVVLEDLSGLDLGETSIRGTFVEAGERGLKALGSRNRACVVKRGGRQTAARSARGYQPVGALYFGPALQSTLTQIPIRSDQRYFLELSQGFPAGLYYVTARQDETPRFEGYLSVPEVLGGVEANGSDFDTDGVLIKRSEGTTVSWNAPAVVSDKSLMLIDIMAEGAEGTVTVRCQGGEPTEGGGVFTWKLPDEHISQLPDADRGLIFVSRVHLTDVKEKGFDVQLQGMRTRVTVLKVRP